ncbi:MAG: hypothetical protein RMJ37_07925 [Spirochaetia bacterium]|nr:DUF3108 domain-containing protein [Spirochaetota bacterium]MCX8096053.1 DUF3108 domain-containing protein [Spirochaetota bacterium]MDW8113241.1 hypothetical protein [Spirochaetia bacterium]
MNSLFKMFYIILISILCLGGYSQVTQLKYYFSVLGIRSGEAIIKVQQTTTNIIITSKIKTYPGIGVFVSVDDTVRSYIDKNTLKTIRRDTISLGGSFKDTNSAVFDRTNNLIVIDSVKFGRIEIYNTNDIINDLATEVYRRTLGTNIHKQFEVAFLEVTNARFITLSNQTGYMFLIKEVNDSFVEFTNMNNYLVLNKASIPVFYVFPFGNISLYVELASIGFAK